jgi:hypothetical protein
VSCRRRCRGCQLSTVSVSVSQSVLIACEIAHPMLGPPSALFSVLGGLKNGNAPGRPVERARSIAFLLRARWIRQWLNLLRAPLIDLMILLRAPKWSARRPSLPRESQGPEARSLPSDSGQSKLCSGSRSGSVSPQPRTWFSNGQGECSVHLSGTVLGGEKQHRDRAQWWRQRVCRCGVMLDTREAKARGSCAARFEKPCSCPRASRGWDHSTK